MAKRSASFSIEPDVPKKAAKAIHHVPAPTIRAPSPRPPTSETTTEHPVESARSAGSFPFENLDGVELPTFNSNAILTKHNAVWKQPFELTFIKGSSVDFSGVTVQGISNGGEGGTSGTSIELLTVNGTPGKKSWHAKMFQTSGSGTVCYFDVSVTGDWSFDLEVYGQTTSSNTGLKSCFTGFDNQAVAYGVTNTSNAAVLDSPTVSFTSSTRITVTTSCSVAAKWFVVVGLLAFTDGTSTVTFS
jgi:hypothetical protein